MMTSVQNQSISYFLSAFLFSAASQGQTLPDAGSVRQQLEPQRSLNLPPQAAPRAQEAAPEIKALQGVSVQVNAWRFVGNTVLSSTQLTSALADFAGQKLDFAGLQRAADAVAAAYLKEGWLVRAYLPEQDVNEGTVTLQVVEARFAGVRLEGEPSKRVFASDTQGYFAQQQKVGELLNMRALDRALLLADDLPGISVAGTLVQGQAVGETALALQTSDEALVNGELVLDNTGARSTGSARVMLNMNINSPGGHGELLNLSAVHTQGSDYARVGLTVPDGYNGLRLGVNASTMRYSVVDGASNLQGLGIQGNSGSLGMDWSFPLVRERMRNLYFVGGIDNKHFYNDNNNKTSDPKSYADYASNSLRLGASGNSFDDLGGGGSNSASLQLLWGQLDQMTAHTQLDTLGRSYNKLNYTLSRQQAVAAGHSMLINLQGQLATQALDSSEKFYVGGAATVRAYPSSELGGESGHVLTGEWRWRLDPNWFFSGFVDQAWVVALPTTAPDASTNVSLRGYGLSLAWQGAGGITAKVTWSRRDGSNPQPTTSGTDGDGTLQTDRIWFTSSLPF